MGWVEKNPGIGFQQNRSLSAFGKILLFLKMSPKFFFPSHSIDIHDMAMDIIVYEFAHSVSFMSNVHKLDSLLDMLLGKILYRLLCG